MNQNSKLNIPILNDCYFALNSQIKTDISILKISILILNQSLLWFMASHILSLTPILCIESNQAKFRLWRFDILYKIVESCNFMQNTQSS